ncbi:packaged DNA stabilization protein [Acinetobacter haemolyticus]|uniref:packaged DNA stabilization protein n=1 Tax=Acinetobacter haemolyticus TaxID=29430 RepID=UPI00300BA3C4
MIKLPLVGPAYKMQAQSISCQNCINWYPQTIEYPNGSRVAALMPTPGLKKIFQGITSAVRCLHVLSNGALLVVIGNKLYHSKANKFDLIEVGLISALGTVRAADNGRVALIVNGTYTYSLDLKNLTLTRLSGSAIPRSTHVVFLDGRFVFNKANTGQFHWSDLYSTNVNALSYATAESTPDNVTAIIEFNSSELWLFGSQSVERYYGAGSANAPYARLSGGAMSFGCLAPDSIVALATGVIWLGVSDFGGSQIVMSAGGVPERISTHALEEEIASFSKTSDAMAYAYQMEGHVFYVITFPSANITFCFDVSTGLWHQRSFTNPQGLHERHRSQHHAFYNNTHIVGDYRNGKLYQLDNNIFTDDGELIMRERTAQAVITDGKLTRFNNLEIVCEVGFEDRKPKPTPQPPVISCEGATSLIHISEDLQYRTEATNEPDAIYVNWHIEVEGLLHPVSTTIGLPSEEYMENIINAASDELGIDAEYTDGYLHIWNKSTVAKRVRLIPDKTYINAMTLGENPTASIDEKTGIISFCLAPYEYITPSCLAEHINPVILKNQFYGYQDIDIICLAYRVTNLDMQSVIESESISLPVEYYKPSATYQVPNALDLTLPNNITSTFYSLSRFLDDIRRRLEFYTDVQRSDPRIHQGTTVKQTYIGIRQGLSGNYNIPITIGLQEWGNNGLLNDFGNFTLTPTSLLDARTKIYNHFKPILEANGYTVTFYNRSQDLFMPSWGMKLSKTTDFDIELRAIHTTTPISVTWDGGWSNWDGDVIYFKETDALDPIVTEEQRKNDFTLTLLPVGSLSQDNLVDASIRVELLTHNEAGLALPQNGVDWIEVNNQGQSIVIDSCYYYESEPS